MKFLILGLIVILIIAGCASIKRNMFTKLTGGKPVVPTEPIIVPFETINSHSIIIEPVLDGYPCSFIFDTGGVTMMDTSMVDNLKNLEVKTAFGKVKLGKVKETNLNNLIVKDLNYMLIPFADTFKITNKPIYGMIGSNFIRHFNTTIDYQRSEIRFAKPQILKKNNANDHLMKMSIIMPYFPTVPATLDGNKFKAMLDTGLSFPIVCPVSAMDKLSPEEKNKAVKAIGFFAKWPFTSKTDNYLYRAKNLKLGDIELNNVLIIFADLPSMIQDDTILIGKFFLENYLTQLNFVNKQVLLTETVPSPNSVEFSTGLNIVINKGKFLIIGIWPNSPADKSGLDLNTTVSLINGRSVEQISNKELSELLFNKACSEIELSVLKGEIMEKIVLKKEKLL